jgi:ABC-type phosphate transport system substrate-binding protein
MIGGLLWLATLPVGAEVVVIVHPESPVQVLTPRQVSDLYLGRSRFIARNEREANLPTAIYEHSADSPVREVFIRSLNGMTLSQLNAYWARLRFSGEVLPPVALTSNGAVIDAVRRDRNAIGYVDANAVDGASVKVVLRLKD